MMKAKNTAAFLLLVVLLMFAITCESNAQVTVVRGGSENPVITIGKSTLYGGATGLLLGLALSLVVDEDTGDIVKWSFVGGTFGGFLLGVYHVATRPQPQSAFLQFDSKGLRVAAPQPQIRLQGDRSMSLPIVSLSL
ncbi:hypothetical protein MJD09_12760 [bacterium]|nr:hypothetical protein [bacterium]